MKSNTRRHLTFVLALAVLLSAGTAFAQETGGEEPADGEAPAAAEEAAAEEQAEEAQPEPEPEPQEQPEASPPEGADPTAVEETAMVQEQTAAVVVTDTEDPLYWAELRDVYTIQQRAFTKEGRFAVTVYGGLIPNNIFEQYFPVGVRLNYFILENIGIELAGSYAFSSDTGLNDLLEEDEGVKAQKILVGDTQLSHTNFGVVWSPFYGKTAFYLDALNYFDLYLFAGAGLVITETVPDFNAEPESEFKPEGALGAGLAFYLGDHAAMRFDFRQFVFQKVVGGVANPSEVSLGLSWFF